MFFVGICILSSWTCLIKQRLVFFLRRKVSLNLTCERCISTGFVGDSLYTESGGGANYLCLHSEPVFRLIWLMKKEVTEQHGKLGCVSAVTITAMSILLLREGNFQVNFTSSIMTEALFPTKWDMSWIIHSSIQLTIILRSYCLLGLHGSIVALNSPYVKRAGVHNRPSMLRLLLPQFQWVTDLV